MNKKITLIGAVVDFLLAVFKIMIGMMGNSGALIADGIHSFSDLATDVLVIAAARHAAQGPDQEHPYGHGRAEYIATLIIAVLLCVVGIEFIETAINRIMNPDSINPAWWMIGAIGVTIFIKEFIESI